MDDLSRSAWIRGATAFVVIAVAGTTLVYAAGRIGSESSASAPPSSAAPTALASPAGTLTPEAWLAWVPGGAPDGFSEGLTAIPGITDTTTATADIAWLIGSRNAAGVIIDSPTPPYMIPIDTTGVDLRSFPSFLPQPERRQVAALQPGEGILSESAAQLRGVGRGATLTFDGNVAIKVVGTLPDQMMGGYELLVDRATGQQLGVTHDRYVLFHVGPSAHPTPQALAQKMEQYLPLGVPHPIVEVREPGTTTYLRANDGELPPVLLKRRFGEFTAYPDPERAGAAPDRPDVGPEPHRLALHPGVRHGHLQREDPGGPQGGRHTARSGGSRGRRVEHGPMLHRDGGADRSRRTVHRATVRRGDRDQPGDEQAR